MLGIELNRKSELQLWRQIYQALKERMLSGNLKSGEALPSTRELARELNVSRNTVCGAYDLLISEGFIISHQGAPTRVSDGLCIESMEPPLASYCGYAVQKRQTNIDGGPLSYWIARYIHKQGLLHCSYTG